MPATEAALPRFAPENIRPKPNPFGQSEQQQSSERVGFLRSTLNKLKLRKQSEQSNKFEIPQELQQPLEDLKNEITLFSTTLGKIKNIGTYIKDNPMQIAGILVPTALGALGMIDQTPIPADLLTRASLISGGSFMGASRGRGWRSRLGLAAVGAGIGALFPEATHYIPGKKAVDTAANLADDAPTIATIGSPAVKRAGKAVSTLLGRR